jgi:hypothetical protein
MTTEEAVALRKALELDILALLQKYRDATGLTPTSVDVQTVDVTTVGANSPRSVLINSVRVTVEL